MATVAGRANGATPVPGMLKLGSTHPETFPVEIDGEEKFCYVLSGRRAPGMVFAALEAAQDEWMAAREQQDDDDQRPDSLIMGTLRGLFETLDADDEIALGEPLSQEVAVKLRELRRALLRYDEVPHYKPNAPAWRHYLNQCTLALVPGITYSQADGIDPLLQLSLLVRAGVIPAGPEEETEEESPPPTAAASTGEKQEQDSLASTT